MPISLRFSCAAAAFALGGCGLVLDFDPEARGGAESGVADPDAGRTRDARLMDAPRDDTGGDRDAGPDERDAGAERDVGARDAGDAAADAGVDAGPPFVCTSDDGTGACSGTSCDERGCGPVEGDRCRAGECFCGTGAPCRVDRHSVCAIAAGVSSCACEAGWTDCFETVPGCETNLLADAESCGACGSACDAGEACVSGSCRACNADSECGETDGLACTTPRCEPDGECKETLVAGTCLIDDVCFAPGDPDPVDPCHVCYPTSDPRDWSVAVGAPCDDGNACTINDRCGADGDCDVSEPETCATDMCHLSTCDPAAGCTESLRPGFCFIGGACVRAGAAILASEPCVVCDPTRDPFGWTSRSGGEVCDDGVPCTESRCGAGSVCRATASTGCPTMGGVCVPVGDVDPTNRCRLCSSATATGFEWAARPHGTPCVAEDGACVFGGACSMTGSCDPVRCEGPSGAALGLVCVGAMCRCATGRLDCDSRADTGCECVGANCATCVVSGDP